MSVEKANPTGGTESQTRPWGIGGDVLQLENTRVVFENGPAGVIARVVYDSGRVDYAGPLPLATICALREVAAND